MSVLVVGLSHKSAPVATLERAVLSGDPLVKLLGDVYRAEGVAGSLVLSTCNRMEVYAEVSRFHAGLASVSELLARHTGIASSDLTPHLYVHYEDRAAQHLLAVTCGLDSMVVGESQILGQVRQAIALARAHSTLGGTLADLGTVALRTGKRARAETGIDRAGPNVVSVGLAAAAARLPGAEHQERALAGLSVLVVGAGSISALAVAAVRRAGSARIVVANRTLSHAERLAPPTVGHSVGLSAVSAELTRADLVVCCTGAAGHVVTAAMLRDAVAARGPGRPLVLLDLALPRDVEAGAGRIPGVKVVDLAVLARGTQWDAAESDVAAVRKIVTDELAAYASASRAAAVAPTVVALRAKAEGVVDAELARLRGRLGGLDEAELTEIATSLRRVSDKLLHAPTVRVKELAGAPGADSYEAALRVLFDLDPDAIRAVEQADARWTRDD